MRVHPTLIPDDTLLGSVSGVFNAVWVRGDTVGDIMCYGRGAGRQATASAVVADIVDVGLNLKFGSHRRVPAFSAHKAYANILPMAEVITRYYLRLQVDDRPGVLARVAGFLGQKEISIASVSQHQRPGNGDAAVPLIILTHKAREADMNAAMDEIRKMAELREAPVLLRIEDLR